MFAGARTRSVRREESDPERKETVRSSNKQALLKNGIQFYEDIGVVQTFLQSKNEDFLPGFMSKIINKAKKISTPNEDFVVATLISKVVKKPETYTKVQGELLQWLETMLEWCFSLLDNDPRDETYPKTSHHHLKSEDFQHLWSVAMLAYIRLISCRETHFELGPKTDCPFLVRRTMALLSNIFLLEDEAIFKPLLNHSTNEEGLTALPITPETYTNSLPIMQVLAMKLGCAMMLTFKDSLLPYGGIFRDLSEQLLKTFHIQMANESIDIPTFQRYRESLRFVEIFVETFGTYSYDSIIRTILPILSKNLSPFQKSMVLWNTNYLEDKKKMLESNASKNKRRKKKDAEEMQAVLKESPLQSACPEAYVLLRSAYVTASTISSIFFFCKQQISRHNEEEAFGSLADTTTRTMHILTLWIEQVNLSANVLHLHVEALERTVPVVNELFKLLQNILLSLCASDAISPFFNQSLHLFRCGSRQNISSEVRSTCHSALRVFDSFIHPRSKPLFIPHAESIEVLYESLRDSVKRAQVGEIIERFEITPVEKVKAMTSKPAFESVTTEAAQSGEPQGKSTFTFEGNNDKKRKLSDDESPEAKRRRIDEGEDITNTASSTQKVEQTGTPDNSKSMFADIDAIARQNISNANSTSSVVGTEVTTASTSDNHADDDESLDVDMESASEGDISDLDF